MAEQKLTPGEQRFANAVQGAIKSVRRLGSGLRGSPAPVKSATRSLTPYEAAMRSMSGTGQSGPQFQVLDPYMMSAQKSLPYNHFIDDFVNKGGSSPLYYDNHLKEQAYRTSVLLFSALRRVAYMCSTAPIAIERKVDESNWTIIEQPPQPFQNIIDKDASNLLFEAYMNYALYGAALVYKQKTERAVQAIRFGRYSPEAVCSIKHGGVAGLHVIPGAKYTLDADYTTGTIRGAHLGQPEEHVGANRYLERPEFAYWHDYDPVDDFYGTSIVSVAINNAFTDAAIREWAARYFTAGALPMLLVMYDGDPLLTSESDLRKYRTKFEEQATGMDNSLRSVFMDRQFKVEQVGIEADKVSAPELTRNTLEGIASAVNIAPDLIIPPEGGSDNARHKYLLMQAWTDTVIPLVESLLSVLNDELGMPDDLRLVIDKAQIDILDADRGDTSQHEIAIMDSTLQTWNEARTHMAMPEDERLNDHLKANGKLLHVDTILRSARVDIDLINAMLPAWNDSLLTRGQVLQILGIHLPPDKPDGYKFEIVVEGSGGAALGTEIVENENEVPNENYDPGEVVQEGGELVSKKEGPGSQNNPGNFPDNGNNDPDDTPPDSDPPTRPEPEPDGSAESTPEKTEEEQPAAAKGLTMGGCGYDIPLEGSDMVRAYVQSLGVKGAEVIIPEDDWHISLAYTMEPVDPDIVYAHLRKAAFSAEGPVTARIAKAAVWDLDSGGNCLVLEVEPDKALIDLQKQAYAALSEYASPNKYTEPTRWKPHITLAYNVPSMNTKHVKDAGNDHLVLDYVRLNAGAGEQSNYCRWPLGTKGVDWSHSAGLIKAVEQDRIQMIKSVEDWFATGQISGTGHLDQALSMVTGDRERAALRAKAAIQSGQFDADADPSNVVLSSKAAQDDPFSELDAWQRVASKSTTKAIERFEVNQIPPSYETQIREALKAGNLEIFEQVRETMDCKAIHPEDIENWATEAEKDADLKGLTDLLD